MSTPEDMPVSWSEFNAVVAKLSARISELESAIKSHRHNIPHPVHGNISGPMRTQR